MQVGGERRVSIVTGGAKGLGAEICRRFATRGDAVVITDISQDDGDALAREIVAAGGSAIALACDVTREDDVARMIAVCGDVFGPPHALVTSAGIGVQKSFLAMEAAEFDRILRVNLTGTFLCCRAAARAMVEAGCRGRIVTIASAAGIRSIPGRSAYGASKAGVINMSGVMAAELGMLNAARGGGEVTVNCIAPGPVESDLTRQMHTDETRGAYVGSIPLARYGNASEIAAAALFLTSPEASYVNGHTLVVDGGMSVSGPLFGVAGMGLHSGE